MRDEDFSRRRFVALSGAAAFAAGTYSISSRPGSQLLGIFMGQPRITISAFSVPEQALVGTTIGAVSVFAAHGTFTFSIPPGGDPDSKFTLDGASLVTADTFDYESSTFHKLTLQADNGVDPVLSRTLLITVTNAFEQPDLDALILPETVTRGSIVPIAGATAGSTISAVSLPNGWTLDSENRQILIANDAGLNEQAWSLLETLSDSRNSPRLSNGRSGVEAPSNTLFDPVAQGFVMFDSRDVSPNGAVSSWQSKNGRNTISSATASAEPSKVDDVVSFDGSDDLLSDAARSLGVPTASYNLDSVWNASPLGDGEQFTNTGITRVPDGTWWVVNHPAGAPSRSDGILVHFNADFSSVLETLDTGAIFGVGTIGGPQGIVYDTDDDTLWFTSAVADEIKHVSLSGVEIDNAIPFPNPAGLAIDQANGTLIILESEGSAANKAAGIIRTVDKRTGFAVGSGTLTDMPNWDQMFFDQESRALFITAGYEYSGNGNTFVGIYNMDGTSYLHQIAYIREPTATAIEGIVFHDGKLFVCNDSGFHGGLGSGLNEVLEYDVGQIIGSRIILASVIQSGAHSGTDAIAGLGFPLSSGRYGVALLIGGPTELRLFNRSASSNEQENYAFTTPNVSTSPRIVVAQLDPTSSRPGRMWVDGIEVSGFVTGGAMGQFTGAVTDRVNLAVGGLLDGVGGKRHSDVEIRAFGYRVFSGQDSDQREEIEGWLAHEFGLSSQLPDSHPYKSNGPGG